MRGNWIKMYLCLVNWNTVLIPLKWKKNKHTLHFSKHIFHMVRYYGHTTLLKTISNETKLQKSAVRSLKFGSRQVVSCRGVFKEMNTLSVVSIYILQLALYTKKYLSLSLVSMQHDHYTRRADRLYTALYHLTVDYMAVKIFNIIPLPPFWNVSKILNPYWYKVNFITWVSSGTSIGMAYALNVCDFNVNVFCCKFNNFITI